MERLGGASPPSVFVGRYGYPKVRIGPMIPPLHGDTTVLDKPEMWSGKTIEEIANYRLSLVRGVVSRNVYDNSGRYLELMQELAMSDRPAESEAIFEKKPLADPEELQREIRLNTEAAPFGPVAPLKDFKTSSLSADSKIEYAYYDRDLRAADAVIQLYESGIEVSRIHRVLSVGMLGLKKNRKLVPTRWSITATDDTISKRVVHEIQNYTSIDKFEVSSYFHLGNYYSVILLPDDIWSFEMVESWFDGKGNLATASDYEPATGLDHYPSIAGAYFAARLAVAEHLLGRRRKAAALVLREIRPEYVMPLGVWQIREGVRQALKETKRHFENFANTLSFACSNLSVSRSEILRRSRLYQSRRQKRITDFLA